MKKNKKKAVFKKPAPKPAPKAEPQGTIVAATGVSVNGGPDKDASMRIQTAMENAIKAAHEAGITDSDKIREMMQAARQAAKA